MKQFYALCLTICFAAFGFGQGADDASSYGGNWNNNDNNGSGFGAWSITTNGTAGTFIGSSHGGSIDTSGAAFGLFSNSGSGNTVSATRPFTQELQDGEFFSIELSTNFRDGRRGINFFDNTNTFLFNFEVGTSYYGTTGWAFVNDAHMILEIAQASTGFTVTIRRENDGLEWSSSEISGSVASLGLYSEEANTSGIPENNFYANNLQITPSSVLSVLDGTQAQIKKSVVASGQLLAGESGEYQINVYNINGQLVESKQETLQESQPYNLDLEQGLYIIQLEHNGKVESIKTQVQ